MIFTKYFIDTYKNRLNLKVKEVFKEMHIHKRGDCNRYMSQHTSCVQCKQSGVHVTVYDGAVLIQYNYYVLLHKSCGDQCSRQDFHVWWCHPRF